MTAEPVRSLPPVSLRVLGRPQIQIDQESMVLGGQRARLLVGLAVAGGMLSVEEVAALLWPAGRPTDWRGALRVLFHDLRRVLERAGVPVGLLERSGPIVLLQPEPVECSVDLWLVRDAARRARGAFDEGSYEEARVLAGEVDASLARPILPGVDDVAVRELRAQLGEERVRNLEVLARSAGALGAHAMALEAVEEALRLEPTNQPVCLVGLSAAEAMGDGARGLALYARLRAALASEFGISPNPALSQAYARLIAANDGGGRRGEPQPVPEPLQSHHPVVGRAVEQAHVSALWGRVERGEGLAAVVVGPAGIGKTVLVGELAGVVIGRGGRVLYGRESDPPGHELTALVETVEAYRTVCTRSGRPCDLGPLGADLETLIGLEPGAARLAPRSRRLRLSQAVHEWWATLGSQCPTLIVLDDLHWSSPTMAGILADLATEGVPEGVLLVGAARATGSRRPAAVGSLVSWGARVVELGPLSLDAVADLLASMGHDVGRFATEVWLASGGNPERIRQLAGSAVWSGGPRLGGTAREVVARLSPNARAIAAAVAVLGRATPASVVLDVAGMNDAGYVEELRTAGIVDVVGQGLLALRHDLLHDDVLAHVGVDERMRLHARAAEVLSRGGVSRQRIARHLVRAAQAVSREELARARLAAAREAARVGAYEDALAELDALGQELSAGGSLELEGLLLRVECLRALGHPQLHAAVAELLERAATRRNLGIAASAAEIVTGALIPTMVGREDADIVTGLRLALQRARRAEHIASLASALALSRVWTAPARERRRLARRAVAALERLAEPGNAALAIATLTRAHLGSLEAAHPAARLDSARRILGLATTTHDVEGVARGHLLAHDALVELGHLDEAGRELQAARLCSAALDDQVRWEVGIRAAGRLLMAGKLREAEAAAEEALGLPRSELLREGAAAVYGAQLMIVREAEGRLAELVEAFAEFRRVQEGWAVWDAAEARIQVARGDHDRAGELLVKGVAVLEDPLQTDITWLARAVQYAWVAIDLRDTAMARRLARLLARARGTVHWSVCVSLGPVDLVLARLLLIGDPSRAAPPLARARRQLAHEGFSLWRPRLDEALV